MASEALRESRPPERFSPSCEVMWYIISFDRESQIFWGATTHPARPRDDLRTPAWRCSRASRSVGLISPLCADLPPGRFAPPYASHIQQSKEGIAGILLRKLPSKKTGYLFILPKQQIGKNPIFCKRRIGYGYGAVTNNFLVIVSDGKMIFYPANMRLKIGLCVNWLSRL